MSKTEATGDLFAAGIMTPAETTRPAPVPGSGLPGRRPAARLRALLGDSKMLVLDGVFQRLTSGTPACATR